MNKSLLKKLTSLSNESLIRIIDLLCSDKETNQRLSLLVNTTQRDIQRELNRFESCCEWCANNRESMRAVESLWAKANDLLYAANLAEPGTAAKICYEMLQATKRADLADYMDDDVGEMVCMVRDGLREAVDKGEGTLSAEELKAYRREIDED